ncbi:MAG: hypothetical protein IJF83_07455 [Methanobrevibacter sp.]|nr:hypothetical protein [Methanobrevibacter sp.]
MKYDNSKTEELVKECYKEIDGITDVLRNMWSVSEFMEDDFLFTLTSTRGKLKQIKDSLEIDYKYLGHREDLTLTALEAYTEGKASWERAGEISGLGIFGLEDYVHKRGVDRYKLRIDPYLDFTGEEAEKIIREEWDKLMNYKEES